MPTLHGLEQQIGQLQAEVRELRDRVESSSPRMRWWEELAGSADGRPLFDAVVRAGREIREAGRKPSRSSGNRRQSSKKP